MSTSHHYGGKIELNFSEDKHIYTARYQEKEKIADGVTSVLGIIAKPALIGWAAKETSNWMRVNFLPETPYSAEAIEALCEKAKAAHRQKRDKAGDVGHLCHAAISNYIKTGVLDMPASKEAQLGIQAFKQWEAENDIRFIRSEYRVYSLIHNFAGTVDFSATVNGKKTLGDFKTGSGIYDSMFLQTAAYDLADNEETGVEYEQHLIVNIRKDGVLETKSSPVEPKNKEAFLAALTLHRRIKEMEYARIS